MDTDMLDMFLFLLSNRGTAAVSRTATEKETRKHTARQKCTVRHWKRKSGGDFLRHTKDALWAKHSFIREERPTGEQLGTHMECTSSWLQEHTRSAHLQLVNGTAWVGTQTRPTCNTGSAVRKTYDARTPPRALASPSGVATLGTDGGGQDG